jgi:uncharacterized protein (TIGR03382 family)
MKKFGWFALVLEISPLVAFGVLAVLCPVGDPQKSHNLLVRILDFQGTYWMRHAIPVPPPLLLGGLVLSVLLRRRHRLTTARIGTVVGIVLLGLWCLIMVVPLLVHVN